MSTINISYSSELMSNYMQGDTLAPDHKFEAIQTDDGHSLLFSIGTDGVFYLTEEITGEKTGWLRNDLSTPLSADYPDATTVSARTFSVGQCDLSGAFSLVLALTIDTQDYLYLATSYQRGDDGSLSVAWQELPFDAAGATLPNTIAGLYTMFTSGAPLIVVDAENPTYGTVDRYYIDAQKALSSTYWNSFALPVDLDATQPIQICGGRKSGGRVDGLYTLGSIGNEQSIVFQELYDPYGGGAGAVSRLYLPDDVEPLSIASTPSAKVASTDAATYTDLYVTTATGDLYYFSADHQQDESQGAALINNDLFMDTSALYAYTVQDKVVVWGLDRAQHIFYTQSPSSGVEEASNWSYPLPLGEGIEQVSPYVNRVNGGNTYFMHTGTNELKKAYQDPISTTWQTQDIILPSDPNAQSQKFDSYTTSLTVTDENNTPLSNLPILLSSSFRTPIYINNHYYVLDTAPITVKTDAMGCVTVIQRVEGTVAACLYAQSEAGGGVLGINPMTNGVSNVLVLNTDDALTDATYTDDKGNNPSALVSTETSSDDISSAATSIATLSDAYTAYDPTTDSVSATRDPVAVSGARMMVIPGSTASMAVDSVGDAIEVAAGDLFDWLSNATEYVIDIVEDAVNAAWNFVCTIAGKVFTFVIDTIEKVVGAIQAIFQFLGVLIKDLIQFMKFLFSWGDIQKTKDVMKNVTLVLLQDCLNAASGLQKGLDGVIDGLEEKITAWGDPDSGGTVPNTSLTDTSPTMNSMTAEGDTDGQNSASNAFLQYHLVNNVTGAIMDDGSDTDASLTTLFDELAAALEEEVDIIEGALESLYNQILKDGNWKSMSLLDILKLTISILAEAMLETAANVMDTLFEIIISVANSVIDALATPVWIPVLSDILDEFFDASIPFSWLDIILLVGALPSTMVYKVATGKAPFSDDDSYTSQLLAATSLEDIYAVINGVDPSQVTRQAGFAPVLMLDVVPQPSDAQVAIFANCRCMVSISSVIAALLVFPVNTPGVENIKFLKVCNVVNALAGAALNATVNFCAQPAPVKSTATNVTNDIFIALLAIDKGAFAAYKIKKNGEDGSGDKVDAALTLVIQALMGLVSIEHTLELIRDYNDYPTQANLAFMQIGVQICGIFNASMECAAAVTPEGVTKNLELGADLGLYGVAGVLQFAQAMYGGIAGED